MKCSRNTCDETSLSLSEFCWDHISDKKDYVARLLNDMKSGKSLAGYNLKKVVLRHVHIEKVDMDGANLSQADLSESYLFDVRLKNAEMVGANLRSCDLSHCDLCGADLTRASLAGARLWNAKLNNANLAESDLSRVDFWNTKLFNVKLWHASFAGCLSLTKANFAGSGGIFDNTRISEAGELAAEESYRDLKQYFMSCGRYDDASWASFKEKTMERLVLRKKRSMHYIPSLIMSLLCGYGEKPSRIVLASISAIVLFALLYGYFNTVQSSAAYDYPLAWSDYLYYSAITFTTVGYGDFIPKPCGAFRLLSALEAFLGVFLSGLFIFTLARKYSAR